MTTFQKTLAKTVIRCTIASCEPHYRAGTANPQKNKLVRDDLMNATRRMNEIDVEDVIDYIFVRQMRIRCVHFGFWNMKYPSSGVYEYFVKHAFESSLFKRVGAPSTSFVWGYRLDGKSWLICVLKMQASWVISERAMTLHVLTNVTALNGFGREDVMNHIELIKGILAYVILKNFKENETECTAEEVTVKKNSIFSNPNQIIKTFWRDEGDTKDMGLVCLLFAEHILQNDNTQSMDIQNAVYERYFCRNS